ncbi:hypothetical protein SpCBS45565_g04695 [Spizellomyces sp. 'palustris']|nr:hypothetical protein SpCBS45565_g04695 [Spizellomyces sp. 'palustris']
MATKYIPPTTVPHHIYIESTRPLPSNDLFPVLTSFLNNVPQTTPDVAYQLTELHKSLEWQIENKVDGRDCVKGVSNMWEESGPEVVDEGEKKKKKKKKGGSKWAA